MRAIITQSAIETTVPEWIFSTAELEYLRTGRELDRLAAACVDATRPSVCDDFWAGSRS